MKIISWIILLIASISLVLADEVTKSSYAAVDINEENIMDILREFYEKPKDTLPLWVSLVTGECTVGECPAFFKTLNLVSDIVKLQNRISVVSCNGEKPVCDTLPKFKPVNNIVSMYIRDGKVFGFEGEQSKEGVLDFMSADAWLEGEMIVGDFNAWYEDLTGTSQPLGAKMWDKYVEINDKFTSKAENTFKKVPYIDRWSANAKVLMAAVFVIPPCIFTAFYLVLLAQTTYQNRQVDKKYERLNAKHLSEKKNN